MKRAAEKMLQRSAKRFKSLEVGSTVIVQVPKFDRSPLDQKNILGKIMKISHELYQVGTSAGVINNLLPRNALEQSAVSFSDDIPNTRLSIREIAAQQSQHGGQGFKKCSCKAKCANNRCVCRKNNMKCNSRCHPANNCSNK
ncbi:unnamed protein product [Brugia timori]|uniref:AWS domain-containing protein n=1 Tax=Brugia timori TaxID=42155 RepID=A0A0R3QFI4_9BILA|nr:unnamed protein product [Brugia timori]